MPPLSPRSKPIVSRFVSFLLALYLCGGLPGGSHGSDDSDFHWIDKEFYHLAKVNRCEPLTQSQKDYPFYELVTDEVFVGWCSERAASYPNFHLIVLTRTSTHPWASCPKFIRLEDVTNPTFLWMERPAQLRGKTITLDQLVYHEHVPFGKPLRPGPKGVKATGPSLWSGERGNIEWFLYCYQGAWLNGGEPD